MSGDGKIFIPFEYDTVYSYGKNRDFFIGLKQIKAGNKPDTLTHTYHFRYPNQVLYNRNDFVLTGLTFDPEFFIARPSVQKYSEQTLIHIQNNSLKYKVLIPSVMDPISINSETGNKNNIYIKIGDRFRIYCKSSSEPGNIEADAFIPAGNYYIYRLGELYGIADQCGNRVLAAEYKQISVFTSEDALLVSATGLKGWFKSGVKVLEPVYESLGMLAGGIWMQVKTSADSGFRLIPQKPGFYPSTEIYEEIRQLNSEPFYTAYRSGNKWGLIREGKKILSADYEHIYHLKGDYLIADNRLFNGLTGQFSVVKFKNIY